MTQPKGGRITSDAELLTHFGFTTDHVAGWFCRTRSSVEKGLASRKRVYFKPGEIIDLRFFAHLVGKRSDSMPILEYLAISRKSSEGDAVRTAFEYMATTPHPGEYDELHILISYLRGMLKEKQEQLFRSLFDVQKPLTLYLSGPLEREQVKEWIGEEVLASMDGRLSIRTGDSIGTQASVLVGRRSNEIEILFPTKNGFIRRWNPNQDYLSFLIETSDPE